MIFVVLNVTRPSQGLAMQIKPIALECPANNLNGVGVMRRAFPEAGDAEQEILKRVAREFLRRGAFLHVCFLPPTKLVGQKIIAPRLASWAGFEAGLAAGENQQGLRLRFCQLNTKSDMFNIARRFSLLEVLENPILVAVGY